MSRIVFVLFAAILTDALTAGQVNVEPNTALLNEGDRTELLCRYGRTINYCRIEIPGEQKVLNLSPEWSKTPGFTYYGAGLQAGQCGVTIERVKASNNGQVKCSLGVEGEELSGTIDLVVALRPQQPIIELLSKPNREGYFAEGTQFMARCSVRDGRPPANISWYIDNMPANKQTTPLEIISTPTNDNVELSTSVQQIQWHLSPEDSNRKLVCRSHHQTDRETVPPQEAAYIINVRYAPVHQSEASVYGLYLDHTAIVNITIRASPLPRIEWTIEGLVVSQGRTEGRYSAYEPQYLGNDEYNVTLAIAGLTLEDTTKIYNLRATNELGLTDYQVRISSSSKPPSNSLDVAAIVGIVVAVAVLVLVVLLVLFARATGRWCFGGKSIKTPTNETSDTESADIKATSTATATTAATTTMGGMGVSATEESSANNSNEQETQEQQQQPQQQQQQQKKAKSLPAFAVAILKRFHEKDARKNKDKDVETTAEAALTLANEQDTPESNAIDGNDNEPKQDKQLVYAELVLKPANETTATPAAAAAAASTGPATTPGIEGAGKNSTEYAEIVYVQKPAAATADGKK
ncbi:fasciclin-3 isoform X2 [Drosophila guanche]|uniref:Blast:Fasciclin-3 n=1 Tax=Drosophila guanche TaxID=7266 RepID=A0A3B0K1Z2_DROGU|nr:fasciclin-3 isoform X2 [Drosophila guanche]SPP79021.1 blast:Fasciclin-3 [Drosophila guanche]